MLVAGVPSDPVLDAHGSPPPNLIASEQRSNVDVRDTTRRWSSAEVIERRGRRGRCSRGRSTRRVRSLAGGHPDEAEWAEDRSGEEPANAIVASMRRDRCSCSTEGRHPQRGEPHDGEEECSEDSGHDDPFRFPGLTSMMPAQLSPMLARAVKSAPLAPPMLASRWRASVGSDT